jgi:hypothetical protein
MDNFLPLFFFFFPSGRAPGVCRQQHHTRTRHIYARARPRSIVWACDIGELKAEGGSMSSQAFALVSKNEREKKAYVSARRCLGGMSLALGGKEGDQGRERKETRARTRPREGRGSGIDRLRQVSLLRVAAVTWTILNVCRCDLMTPPALSLDLTSPRFSGPKNPT